VACLEEHLKHDAKEGIRLVHHTCSELVADTDLKFVLDMANVVQHKPVAEPLMSHNMAVDTDFTSNYN
jgi:hypothetical protein